MSKEKTSADARNIRKLVEEKKVIVGLDRTMKMLKQGKLATIYMASNTEDSVKEDLGYYTKLNSTELILLNESNEELGVVCKKPFLISVLGVVK